MIEFRAAAEIIIFHMSNEKLFFTFHEMRQFEDELDMPFGDWQYKTQAKMNDILIKTIRNLSEATVEALIDGEDVDVEEDGKELSEKEKEAAAPVIIAVRARLREVAKPGMSGAEVRNIAVARLREAQRAEPRWRDFLMFAAHIVANRKEYKTFEERVEADEPEQLENIGYAYLVGYSQRGEKELSELADIPDDSPLDQPQEES